MVKLFHFKQKSKIDQKTKQYYLRKDWDTIMLRFENEGNTISVKLPKTDYTVHMMATYDKDNKIYNTKMYIERNDVNDLSLIKDDCKLKSDSKVIRYDMANYITEQFNNGFFDYYMDRYEYQQKCFAKGLQYFEDVVATHE